MMRRASLLPLIIRRCPEFIRRAGGVVLEEWQDFTARTNFGGCLKNYRERMNTIIAARHLVAVRAGLAVNCRTRWDGVTKVSRYGYPAGFGPLVRRAF